MSAAPAVRDDRPTTRALARAVPAARVDDFDRARFTPAPTDYLDVAAAGETLAAPRIRRRSIAPAPQATVLRPGSDELTVEPSVVRRAAAAVAADRSPGLRRDASLDLATVPDVAVRPGPARRARPVLPLDQLVPLQQQEEPSVDAVAPRSQRSELPDLSSSLRQVASTFRASERDGVQVLTLPAARRAVSADQPRRPTMTAVLERDDQGRVVRAKARRLTGARAGETILLDAAELGVDLDEAPTATQRATARAEEAVEAEQVAPQMAVDAPMSTILAMPPTAWAEERFEEATDAPTGERRVASTPVRRAGRRWRRPVPEGPVVESPALRRADAADESHRLTAPASRRRAEPRPAMELALPQDETVQDELDADAPTARERRWETHGANTWTDLARRAETAPLTQAGRVPMRVADDSPSWVRRAVDPHPVERDEREVLGSRIRSGSSGLLNALARASEPEEIVRVIVQKSHEAGALARQLPGEAGRILTAIAGDGDAQQILATPHGRDHRAERGESVRSTLSRRDRGRSLLAPAQTTFRSGGGPSQGGADATQGVGMSKVMKLASKLRKLIHLAENARLAEARSQVRLAEDSAEARHEVGAGRGGSQSIGDENMHLEALREEVMRHVQQKLETNKSRIEDGDDGWW